MNREDMKVINRLLREIGEAEAERRVSELHTSLGLNRRRVAPRWIDGSTAAANEPSYRQPMRVGGTVC